MSTNNSELINIIRENSLIEPCEQDDYINMILKNFNSNDEEIFLINFYLYQKFNKFTDYIVDLEQIYKWIGFSTLGNAKKTLVKHFIKDSDYKISLIQMDKQKSYKEFRGGQNKENIMLNVHTFKKLCLKSQTANASKIHDYYIKLEDIIYDYIISSQTKLKEKHKLETKGLKEEHSKALTEISNLKQETEQLKSNKISAGYIYIGGDLKENNRCIYKVGHTIDPPKRLSTLNTGSVERSFVFYNTYPTTDRFLAEKIIHFYLHSKKYNYKNEYFDIDMHELIKIVTFIIFIVDNMCNPDTNSLYNIDEFKKAIGIKQEVNLQEQTTTNINNTTNNITNNIVINYIYYDKETYQSFIKDKLVTELDAKLLTSELMNEFVQYTKDQSINAYKSINGGTASSYYYAMKFKTEFVDMMQDEFVCVQTKFKDEDLLYNNKKGFRNLTIKKEY